MGKDTKIPGCAGTIGNKMIELPELDGRQWAEFPR